MTNLLHISSNVFPDLNSSHSTKKIWEELSIGFNEYHILARSKNNKFSSTKRGNIHLHLIPNLWSTKSFFFSSIYMKHLIKKYKITVLLSQCSILGGPIAAYYSKKYSIPLMTEIHGMEYFRILNSSKKKYSSIKKIMKYTFSNSTKVRSLSPKMTELLKSHSIVTNVVEIPNRVNLEIFSPPKSNFEIDKNEIKIVSVGRFVWEKNYEMAINVIAKMQKKYPLKLILIGDGPLKEKYERIIDENNSNVEIHSWMSQEKFVPLVRNCDIYIQTSSSEGLPRTLLEAMALKLPVITTNVGAIEGVVRNYDNGILIVQDDPNELEKSLSHLIENLTLRQELAENAYLDVLNNYEWKSIFKKYREELLEMR